MTETSIEEKTIITSLDTLADYEEKRDNIEAEKKKLLDDVQTPQEIKEIIRAGQIANSKADNDLLRYIEELNKQANAELDKIQIPDEVKELLADIDRQRNKIRADISKKVADQTSITNNIKLQNATETQIQTQSVFDQLEQRRKDIEAEFSGFRKAVNENIDKLKNEIISAVKQIGYTVQGSKYMAVYVKGKKSWNAKRLDAYVEDNPGIKSCYDVGDPSISFRKV